MAERSLCELLETLEAELEAARPPLQSLEAYRPRRTPAEVLTPRASIWNPLPPIHGLAETLLEIHFGHSQAIRFLRDIYCREEP